MEYDIKPTLVLPAQGVRDTEPLHKLQSQQWFLKKGPKNSEKSNNYT